jgi:hypothetical protein
MADRVIKGADILLYINNKLYNPAQGVSYTVDHQDEEIYGVDSFYPQEIAPKRGTISGSIRGIRTKNSGGLAALGIRPLAVSPLKGNYVSIRIKERLTGEDIIFIPQCRVFNEQNQVDAKGTWKLSFSFKGIVAFMSPDRGTSGI